MNFQGWLFWFLKVGDAWAKYKEKVPNISYSNQNVEKTTNYKFKFTELKDLFIKRVQKNLVVKNELHIAM